MIKRIGYQGEAGANSHIACNLYDKKSKPIALKTFDEVFVSLEKNKIDLVIFNNELSPSQERNLENLFKLSRRSFR